MDHCRQHVTGCFCATRCFPSVYGHLRPLWSFYQHVTVRPSAGTSSLCGLSTNTSRSFHPWAPPPSLLNCVGNVCPWAPLPSCVLSTYTSRPVCSQEPPPSVRYCVRSDNIHRSAAVLCHKTIATNFDRSFCYSFGQQSWNNKTDEMGSKIQYKHPAGVQLLVSLLKRKVAFSKP